MKTTIAVILLLNANMQPMAPAQIYPFAMTRADCLELAKRANKGDDLAAKVRTTNPSVHTAVMSCATLGVGDANTLRMTVGQ